ncbi:MAG: hypothetical protein L6R42_007266 [Xanthoria sp. 1 TBL-2021]|nr:MAG: hypothetical protein L6R42_007266 [Xanthoria sp. 1 TBL-2021]
MEIQTIEQEYVDMKKLLKLLKDLFGNQKCEIEVGNAFYHTLASPQPDTESLKVQDEYIILTAPRLLTEEEKLSLHPDPKL